MNGLLGRCIGMAALATVALGGAGSASAGRDNCDSYAKLTLQQAKQNIDRRCGFTGPRWSLDANKHRQWCREEGPAAWRAELKIRNQMLSKCK